MSKSTPSSPKWLTLGPDEQIRLRVVPSTNLVLGSLAVGFVLLILMSVAVGFFTDRLATGQTVSFAVLVLVVALLVAAYAVIKTREYVLTNERAYVGTGLTKKRVSSVDLDRVSDVTVRQSTWQRLLNVGTLRFVADGAADSVGSADAAKSVHFSLVENPVGVYQRVLQFVDITEEHPP